MVMAGEAVDEVRRSLQRQGAQLKGTLWTLRGNPWNLEPAELQTRGRLAPFRKLAKTFRQYWAGIVSYFLRHITQTVEGINGIIQLAKRRARGCTQLPTARF
jgi:hypothetical protein